VPDIYRVVSRRHLAGPVEPTGVRRARFDELYAGSRRAVLGYVLRRAESREDAADALAETFLIAWRRLDAIPDGDGQRLWLYGVARRVLANQRRGQKRRIALTQRLRTELVQAPTFAERSEALTDLTDAFKRLSEADQEILALEGWEELNPAQIAVVLDCSQNAARIRLHRARRRLVARLASQNAEHATTDTAALTGEVT
jgi:RNA polymerase sigma-70 factor (ECF subfamily)